MMIREVREAVKAAGGSPGVLAHILGVSAGAFHVWKEVPAKHVLAISRATGIPPHKLRKDLYPPGEIVWNPTSK